MKKLLFATIIFFAFSNQFLNAQHIRLDKKEMAFLASQEKVNVVFTYDSVHFNEDNFSESQFLEYIKEKIEHKRNLEEALIWEKKYFKSKDSIFPEIFVAALNNRIKDYDYPVTFILNDHSLKYTMKVQTDWMYFGYNAGVVKQPAKGNLKISFYDTSSPQSILSVIEIERAEGLDLAGAVGFSFYSPQTGWYFASSMMDQKKLFDEILKASEEYPRPSLIRMGNMYDKAAVRFGMTLKRVLD